MSIRKSPQHAKAHYLYMNTSLTREQIATAAAVTRKTVGKWIKTGNWAAQKQATYYSPRQVINQLFEELRLIDQNINQRDPELRFATKEENELRARLSALITAHLKNGGVNWRNTAPEYEYKNENIIDLNALSALERKNLEKRKLVAEEDANTSYGKRFSEEELNKYYTKVANLLALADSTQTWEDDDHNKKEEKDEQGKKDNQENPEDDPGVWEPLG